MDRAEKLFPPQAVRQIGVLPGNEFCCDCSARDTEWASVNHGTLICIACAGVHRSLGVNVSFVRSMHMDTWTDSQIEMMRQGGNGQMQDFFQRLELDKDSSSTKNKYMTKGAIQYRQFLKDRVTQILNGDIPGGSGSRAPGANYKRNNSFSALRGGSPRDSPIQGKEKDPNSPAAAAGADDVPMPKVFSVVFQKGPMGLALKRGNSNNNNSDTQGGSPGSNGVIKPSLQRAVSAPVGKVSFPFTSAVASNANKNLPGASCVVSQVQAGLQAERLGLWVGDSLLNVGGEVVPQFDDLMLAIRGAPRPLQMTFVRSPPTVKSPPKALSPPKNGNISTSGENSPIATPPHTLTEANTNADTSRSTSTSEESERSVLSEGINISTCGSKSSGSKSEGGSTATGGLRDDLRMRLNLSSLSIPTDSSTEKDKDRDKDKEKDKERVKDKDKDKEKEKEKRGSDEKKSRVSRRRSYSGEFQTPTKGKEGKEGKVSGCTPVTPVSADKRTPTKGITPNIATSTNSSNSTNAKARSTSWNGSSSSELRDALNSSGNGSGGKSPRVRTPREGGSGKNTPRGIGGKGETPTKNSNSSSNSNGSNNKTTPNSTSSGGSRRRSSSGSGSMGEGGGSSGKKSSTPSTPTPSSSSGPTGSTGGAGAGSSAAKKRLSFDNGGSGGSSGTGRKSPAAPINVFERLSPKAGGKGVGVGKHSPRQSVGAGVGRSSPSNTGRISPSNNSISNGNGNDNGNGHHTQSSSTGRGSPKLSLNAAASPASPTKEGFRAKAAVVPLEYRVVFPAPPLGMTLTKNAHFNTAEVTKLATAGQALTMGVQVGDVVVGLDSDWAGSFDDLMHLLPKKAFPYALVLRRNAMSPRTSMQSLSSFSSLSSTESEKLVDR